MISSRNLESSIKTSRPKPGIHAQRESIDAQRFVSSPFLDTVETAWDCQVAQGGNMIRRIAAFGKSLNPAFSPHSLTLGLVVALMFAAVPRAHAQANPVDITGLKL